MPCCVCLWVHLQAVSRPTEFSITLLNNSTNSILTYRISLLISFFISYFISYFTTHLYYRQTSESTHLTKYSSSSFRPPSRWCDANFKRLSWPEDKIWKVGDYSQVKIKYSVDATGDYPELYYLSLFMFFEYYSFAGLNNITFLRIHYSVSVLYYFRILEGHSTFREPCELEIKCLILLIWGNCIEKLNNFC